MKLKKTMPTAKIDDISVYYEVYGQGMPLVLIGGFGADHTMWDSIVEPLSSLFKVIRFDNRGAGRTSAPEAMYSIEQMANDVALLCDHLGINEAYFIGSSMGGMILQALSYRFPALVKKAVISNSALNCNNAYEFFLQTQLKLIKEKLAPELIINISCSWVFSYEYLSQPDVIEAFIQKKLNNPYAFTLTGYSGQYAAISSFDSTSWVDKIKVPALVVGATDDLIFNQRQFDELAAQMPHAKKYMFEKTGHLPHFEHPANFIKLVSNFFNG